MKNTALRANIIVMVVMMAVLDTAECSSIYNSFSIRASETATAKQNTIKGKHKMRSWR